MSEEEYIVSHRDGDEEENFEAQKQPDFRFLVITTTASDENDTNEEAEEGIQVTTENIEEFLLSTLTSIEAINDLFDAFDSKIAYPNEGHIKYEVGSDGLCVVIVDNEALKTEVVEFVLSYGATTNNTLRDNDDKDDENDEDESERSTKKRK